ncbi:hypothetical protein ACLQ3K_24965 [Tsukamurella sp. DT100]|uniref:hypothetical protein n=1 Tax=Tsukamurella sp. DT100 TaxID=3393415 RepID=UPI003CF1EE67
MEATTVAIVAVCIASVSGLITFGGLIWQVTLYRLSGARLQVQLVFEFRNDGCTRSLTGTRRRSWESAGMAAVDPLGLADPLGIECARVRVTNVGRSPVSVENISLDLGRTRWFRRGRRTAVPMSFHERDHKPQEQATGRGQPPVRLEAGAVTSEVFHLWPFVASEASNSNRRRGVKIRASATAAGRRPTLSRRRFAWRFRDGEHSWFPDTDVTPSWNPRHSGPWSSFTVRDRRQQARCR